MRDDTTEAVDHDMVEQYVQSIQELPCYESSVEFVDCITPLIDGDGGEIWAL